MAIAGPQHSTSDVAVADLRAADERDLVASMHQSGGQPTAAWEAVRTAGLFGPRTNIVHGAGLSDHWVTTLVGAGVSFTTTPENELGHGHCTPITGQLLRLGAAPSLGTEPTPRRLAKFSLPQGSRWPISAVSTTSNTDKRPP
jgi:cytosine/adenosine deaminase-related metal-dependent hydrolase